MLTKNERAQRDAARKVLRRFSKRESKDAKAKRAPNPKADRGRVRDPGFLAFLRRQPCAVGPVGCNGAIQACHVRYGRPGEPPTGLQRKPSDRRAVGMCRGHHLDNPDAQHRSGERAWWAARGIDPPVLADQLFAKYLSEGV